MSTAANADVFHQPHWRVIALGFATESWFVDAVAEGTGGIEHPSPTTLRSGQYCYRFASSTASPASCLGGGWWLDFENFMALKSFAATNGYRLRDAARLILALPYSWPGGVSRIDLLVRAYLQEPLRAYTGYGKPARGGAGADRGTRWIPPQHAKVRQLYIPGLYIKGREKQLYETAFAQPAELSSV